MAGSRVMALRAVAGFAIGGAGLLITARLLGATEYGRYAVLATLATWLVGIAGLGLPTWVSRTTAAAIAPHAWRTALTAAAGAGTLAALAGALLGWWLHRDEGIDVRLVALVFAAVPLQVVTALCAATLESDLRFAAVARIELAAQIGFHLLCVGLAVAGLGAEAIAVAALAAQMLTCAALLILVRRPLRPAWDAAAARTMLGFGLRANLATQVWQLRQLVIPLVLAPIAGVTAVGIAALAWRILDMLSFPRSVAWRVGLPILGRSAGDAAGRAEVVSALQLGQAAAVTAAFAAFAVIAPWLGTLLGGHWTALPTVIPLLAAALLANALFNMPSAVLLLDGRTALMCAFHGLNVALLAGATALLAPRHGALALAYAEAIACCAYLVVDLAARRAGVRAPLGIASAAVLATVLAAAMHHPWAAAAVALVALAGGLAIAHRVARATHRPIAGEPA